MYKRKSMQNRKSYSSIERDWFHQLMSKLASKDTKEPTDPRAYLLKVHVLLNGEDTAQVSQQLTLEDYHNTHWHAQRPDSCLFSLQQNPF